MLLGTLNIPINLQSMDPCSEVFSMTQAHFGRHLNYWMCLNYEQLEINTSFNNLTIWFNDIVKIYTRR